MCGNTQNLLNVELAFVVLKLMEVFFFMINRGIGLVWSSEAELAAFVMLVSQGIRL